MEGEAALRFHELASHPAGRTLAIGDIHGCLRALDTLLDQVGPEPADRLIFLGDYVDRGPDSRGVLDRLLEISERFETWPLIGNHDLMMLAAPHTDADYAFWTSFGGDEALASYAPADARRPGILDDVPPRHWELLEHGLYGAVEDPTHFFAHAGLRAGTPLIGQDVHALCWRKLSATREPHVSGKTLVCGHTAQKTGLPLDLGHTICIDTWVYGDGWLSCLEVGGGQIWQANQAGKRRNLHRGDLARPVQ